MVSARTDIRVTALDGVLNINSFFTFAIFIGVSSTNPGQSSLEGPQCNAGSAFDKSLFVFEVLSFSCFLSSSLIALGLKLGSLVLYSKELHGCVRAPTNLPIFRLGMFFSGSSSWLGCLFLMISMVLFIQIRLEIWSCGSANIYISVCVLVVLVGGGLVLYLCAIWEASRQEARVFFPSQVPEE